MKRRAMRVLLVAAALGCLLVGAKASDSPRPRILVGPNVFVSHNNPLPHFEVLIDAAPWDPNVLVGTGTVIVPAGVQSGRTDEVYSTTDGGARWHGQILSGTYGDPQVAAGEKNTLLFVGLADDPALPAAKLVFARSVDRGETWSHLTNISKLWDHPQIVVDHTAGRFHGRIYVSALYGSPDSASEYNLGLFRSADEGRTWQGPAFFRKAYEKNSGIGYNTLPPLVMSDGTLILPYNSFYIRIVGHAGIHDAAWLTTSTDGGVTFTPRRHVQDTSSAPGVSTFPGSRPPSPPAFAVDTSSRYRNRIYLAWCDNFLKAGRIFVRHTDDRGRTWSPTVFVDPGVPAQAEQSMQLIAVNNDGIVGVSWHDFRHSLPMSTRDNGIVQQSKERNDEYFAASVDGGATFLPAVRVSTQSSVYADRQFWEIDSRSGANAIEVGPGLSYRADDGDYSGLTADARGIFHPFWVSWRGTPWQQVYTAAVRVEGSPVDPLTLRRTSIANDGFRIEYDAPHYDEATGIVEVPVRVINRSGRPLYTPLTLTATLDKHSSLTLLNGTQSTGIGSGTEAAYELQPVVPGMLFANQGTLPMIVRLRLKALSSWNFNVTFAFTAGTLSQ